MMVAVTSLKWRADISKTQVQLVTNRFELSKAVALSLKRWESARCNFYLEWSGISSEWVNGLMQLANCFSVWFLLYSISPKKELIQSYNFISGPQSLFWSVNPCPSSNPTSHLFVNTSNATFACAQQISFSSYLVGTFKGNYKCWKSCVNFNMCVLPSASYNDFLKSLKLFISNLLMCDLDWFYKIQSHIATESPPV